MVPRLLFRPRLTTVTMRFMMLGCYVVHQCYYHRHLRNLLTLISYFTLANCHAHFSAPAFVCTKTATKVVTSLKLEYDDFSEFNLNNGGSIASITNNNNESSHPSNCFPKLYNIMSSPPISYPNDVWYGCCILSGSCF